MSLSSLFKQVSQLKTSKASASAFHNRLELKRATFFPPAQDRNRSKRELLDLKNTVLCKQSFTAYLSIIRAWVTTMFPMIVKLMNFTWKQK